MHIICKEHETENTNMENIVHMDGDDFTLAVMIAEIIDAFRSRLIDEGNTEEEADEIIPAILKMAYTNEMRGASDINKTRVQEIFAKAESWRWEDIEKAIEGDIEQ